MVLVLFLPAVRLTQNNGLDERDNVEIDPLKGLIVNPGECVSSQPPVIKCVHFLVLPSTNSLAPTHTRTRTRTHTHTLAYIQVLLLVLL